MATQANYCVTAYVFHHFVDFLPSKTLPFLNYVCEPPGEHLTNPWMSCGSLIDAIWICVYQGDFKKAFPAFSSQVFSNYFFCV